MGKSSDSEPGAILVAGWQFLLTKMLLSAGKTLASAGTWLGSALPQDQGAAAF